MIFKKYPSVNKNPKIGTSDHYLVKAVISGVKYIENRTKEVFSCKDLNRLENAKEIAELFVDKQIIN